MTPSASMSLPPELPRESSFLKRLIISLKTLNVLKDEAANPEKAWLLHTAMDDATYEAMARELRPGHERLFTERPTVPGKSLDELARLPEGTLGHTYAGYFRKNGIFPFTYEFPLQSDADVLYKRYRETHDIHHLLTGYGIDPFGEIEIQAFYVANLGLRHAKLILFTGIPYLFVKQRSIANVVRRLRAAYRHGKRSRNVLTLPYEELWATPVSELSARYCPREA